MNDMDRYFWRTGQHWSGHTRTPKIHARAILFVVVSFIVTLVALALLR